jgi:hypothetical protein
MSQLRHEYYASFAPTAQLAFVLHFVGDPAPVKLRSRGCACACRKRHGQ